jgi:hypothetical protein
MRRAFLCLASAALAATAAAKPRSGVLSSDFVGKPVGARFIGLAESGAAVSGAPESPVWNPASLHDLPASVFSADFDVARQSRIKDEVLTGGLPLRGRKLTYLGFASTDAAFFYRPLANFNQRDVTDLSGPDNNFIDENLRINQFGFSAASEGEKGAVMGLNVSYLMAHRARAVVSSTMASTVDFAEGHGFSLDLGFRRKTDHAALGVALFNIPGYIYWNKYRSDQLPVLMRVGTSFYPVPVFGLVAEYDKRFYRRGLDRPEAWHLALEITPLPWFQIRGGTYGEDLSDPEKTSYAAGFSAASSRQHQVDFALKTYRFQDERVYNYFLSILLPLPETGVREKGAAGVFRK